MSQALKYHTVVNPNPMASLRLVCLYHAGGNAMVYRSWACLLSPLIEVVTIELPGHGARINEPLWTAMDELVPPLAEEIYPLLHQKPFALFGHSMGALVSFELTRHLRRYGGPLPRCLFVSGRQAPQIPPETAFYTLSNPDLIHMLAGLDGTPQLALEHAELMALFLPVIRADFQICETYEYQPEPPLPCPIVTYSGTEDRSINKDHLDPWRAQTSAAFDLKLFPGGHFYLRSAEVELLHSIGRHLAPYLQPAPGLAANLEGAVSQTGVRQ